MASTNDTYMTIIKRIFKGNRGSESKIQRQIIEVMLFEASGVIPGINKQAWIDKAKSNYVNYLSQIKGQLGEETLANIEDPVEEPSL